MKLRHQLILLQGKQIKVGSLISFFYCEECDENIFNTMEKLSDEEFNRISYILSEALYLKENFEEVWEKKIAYRVSCTKNSQRKSVERMANKEIKRMREELKAQKSDKKISREEAKKIKEELIEKYTKENKKLFKVQIEKIIEKMLSNKEINYEETLRIIEEYVPRVRDWTPYLEREVIEVYDSIVDENCKIIRIAGLEKSKYWDKDEYNRDVNKGGK